MYRKLLWSFYPLLAGCCCFQRLSFCNPSISQINSHVELARAGLGGSRARTAEEEDEWMAVVVCIKPDNEAIKKHTQNEWNPLFVTIHDSLRLILSFAAPAL